MPFEGVLFSQTRSPVRMEIGETGALRETVGRRNLPAVIAVRKENLSLFAQHAELFIDRRRKDTRKGLAEILLGHVPRFPYVSAKFTALGRLKQSASALLRRADETGEQSIYILGLDDPLFNESWAHAARDGTAETRVSSDGGILSLLKPLPDEDKLTGSYWGDSNAYHVVRQLILYAARTLDPVLIFGETGSGKGVVAGLIHKCQHPDAPFVAVNCAAIPGELVESELFGHEPNAFTGAGNKLKRGMWELAGNGTLYLDEIGDLRPDHQAKILHALEDKVIRRVGGLVPIPISARIIAATNRNLLGMVQAGKFRKDLYYRLRNFVILTPALRDHPADIPAVANALWHKVAHAKSNLPTVILEELSRQRWPGNVRELRSVLSALHTFFDAGPLTREKLRAVFQYFGFAPEYDAETEDTDANRLPTDCLRIILRADDAIHACEEQLKELASGHRLTERQRESLLRSRFEIKAILQSRMFFGSHETYDAVLQVEENLGRLLAFSTRRSVQALAYLRDNLRPAIRAAVDRLFAEIQKLRRT